MLAKRVIPCLDVKDGRVVKGVRFVELRDAGDPVEAALAYDAQGADELVFLDITASHEGRATMLDVVRRTAEGIYMPLTVGGGVREPRRRPDAAPGRRRQGLAEHRGAGAARADPRGGASASAASASSWRSTPSAEAAAAEPAGASRSTRTAGGGPPGRDAVAWAREAVDARARARSC